MLETDLSDFSHPCHDAGPFGVGRPTTTTPAAASSSAEPRRSHWQRTPPIPAGSWKTRCDTWPKRACESKRWCRRGPPSTTSPSAPSSTAHGRPPWAPRAISTGTSNKNNSSSWRSTCRNPSCRTPLTASTRRPWRSDAGRTRPWRAARGIAWR